MNDMQYCIECEQVVDVYGNHTKFHTIPKEVFDWDVCNGPFTTSAPPVMDGAAWDFVFANVPSDEELEGYML
jgi:hypothetical protein